MLDEEKQQRGKIVESLRGTIQRVRAAGHEEDRLQNELVQLTTQLVQERRKREQAVCECTAAQQECKELREQLINANTQKLEAQRAAKCQTLEVRSSCHSFVEFCFFCFLHQRPEPFLTLCQILIIACLEKLLNAFC
jgi:DNA-binding protein H-NS